MKILAIEKEIKTVDWKEEEQTLLKEAQSVYKMLLSDNLREIYFTEKKNAVLILECKDKLYAKQLLNQLPLVQKGIISFDMFELHPYTGLTRLMIEE